MGEKLFSFQIETTEEQEFIDLNQWIKEALQKSQVKNGIALVYCPHTTAGITINENADPDVSLDCICSLNQIFPVQGDYHHWEGNAHAHIKSSLLGVEKTIIIRDGKYILGTWQGVFFCEFDGPRKRNFFVKIIAD